MTQSQPAEWASTCASAPAHVEKEIGSAPAEDKRKGIDEHWNSLGADEREKVEAEIAKVAPPFLRQQYADCKGKKERELLFRTVRQAIIDDHVREILATRSEKSTSSVSL